MARILLAIMVLVSACWETPCLAGQIDTLRGEDIRMTKEEARRWIESYRLIKPKTIAPPQTPNPKYLLALRYLGSVSKQREYAIYFDTDWVYLYEVYATKEEIVSRLQQPCGWDSSSVVGCWSLTDDRRVEIKFREVPHEKKREIVTDKWIEKVWEIK